MTSLEHLQESKKKFRRRMRGLSPTEKIRQLELLQKRVYSILKSRAEGGGRPIPEDWQRWAQAQEVLKK